jgi:hypothetical protein
LDVRENTRNPSALNCIRGILAIPVNIAVTEGFLFIPLLVLGDVKEGGTKENFP